MKPLFKCSSVPIKADPVCQIVKEVSLCVPGEVGADMWSGQGPKNIKEAQYSKHTAPKIPNHEMTGAPFHCNRFDW